MGSHWKLIYFTILTYFWAVRCQSIEITKDGLLLSVSKSESSNSLQLSLKQGAIEKLKAEIGVRLVSNVTACGDLENCLEVGNNIRLHVSTHMKNGFSLYWVTSDTSVELKDCYELGDHNWFGGPERSTQKWPVEKLTLSNFANVPQENQFGAIVEPYWLNSAGAYIFVNEKTPLFINQNTLTSRKKVCFSAKTANPYLARKKVVLHYTIIAADNPKEAHLHAVENFLGKPTGHPNYRIIERPIWSTWARYKRDINDDVLLKYAKEIVDNGYSYGQFEIDDDWEDCYGALTFRQSKFARITETVAEIKKHNFTVTLWVHPFTNTNCEKYFKIGEKYDFFAKNTQGSHLTQWWNSNRQQAAYLDFTNPEARNWFAERLRLLQENHGIDAFKFDAGESSWSPQPPDLSGDPETSPYNIVVDFVRTCATFGDLIEIRTGWGTQNLPVLVRMLDKDSKWGVDNGLYTLITTLLQMNMNGYTLVLPDMVGGNGYNEKPDAELFVRWLQANTFMPTIQFSYAPWDYADNKDIDVSSISRRYVNLHQEYAPYILQQMQKSIDKGHPVNAPIWWIDPTDANALKEDTEYLLGDVILVAPVIEKGATARNVYLPNGTWIDGNNGTIYTGPVELKEYYAPIEVLPYFRRIVDDNC